MIVFAADTAVLLAYAFLTGEAKPTFLFAFHKSSKAVLFYEEALKTSAHHSAVYGFFTML